MKQTLLILIVLFPVYLFSQEICNNGIDDDGDGLVDYNDTEDCNCNISNTIIVPSLIPNPSFEEHSECPDGPSELYCADTWIQAGTATTDYYHTCDYTGPSPIPFPDGDACVGMFFVETWREYVGACLLSELVANEQYQINFNLAFDFVDGMPQYTCNSDNNLIVPIEVTLYGTSCCEDLPFIGSAECPVGQGDWHILGSVLVDPYSIQSNWADFTIDFTPESNIEAIIIGPPCEYPQGSCYIWDFGCAPYMFIDNLVLNKADLFQTHIHELGDFCTDDLSLYITSDTLGTVQWYYENIALVGETDTVLNISENSLLFGEYQAVFTTEQGCVISEIFVDTIFNSINDIQNVVSCSPYDLPEILGNNLSGNENYYTAPNGQGSIINTPISSTQIVYVFDNNGVCTSEENFTVTILPHPQIDNVLNDTACDIFELPIITGTNLSGNQGYFYESGGISQVWDNNVYESRIIYAYDDNGGCTDEVEFQITIYDTPILDEQDNHTYCLAYELPEITGFNLSGNQAYYSEPEGQGNLLNSTLIESQTVYLYDSFWQCSDESSFELTIVPEFIANPGIDQVVCGNSTEMTASLNYYDSEGFWTGPGTILDNTSETTFVSADYGTHTYTWTEVNSICTSERDVSITFIEQPNPSLVSSFDSICQNSYQMSVGNSNFNGYWTAYLAETSETLNPAPLYYPSSQSSEVEITINNFQETIRNVEFVWIESNNYESITCSDTISSIISFIKQPVASVGADDEAEVCGEFFDGLNADMTGSEWAEGQWVSPELICDFDNVSLPNTAVSFNGLGIYGDSAFVRVPLLWTVSNYICQDIDTMWLNMYQQPVANAGLNNAVCGNDYTLEAFYDLSSSGNYSPSGLWSVYSGPEGVASIADIDESITDVTAQPVGIWQFLFRENNSLNPSCFDVDTVTVEFLEVPVISAGEDMDFCGKNAQLNAISAGYPGSWLVTPGVFFFDPTDPNTQISVQNYEPIELTWLESNMATLTTLSCTSMDEVVFTFYPQPEADILIDEEDRKACGLVFDRLRAENPGSEITGYWFDENSATAYGDVFSNDTWTQVSEYGCFDFFWIEQSGPLSDPGFCVDTAGPVHICFYEYPTANAGSDTLFCGLSGELSAIPSVGTGVWSIPSEDNIDIIEIHNPTSEITSEIYNTDLGNDNSFTIIWMEDNNGCTDYETIEVIFGRIPQSEIIIIPPKCKGEQATIVASDTTHLQYSWNYFGGDISNSLQNDLGGNYQNFVSWDNNAGEHIISLMVTSEWGCMSPIRIDTVYEPKLPEFDYTIVADTCLFSKGGIVINDTVDITYFWMNQDIGPALGTPITEVVGIPIGTYSIESSYLTQNLENYAYYIEMFGSAKCIDTFAFEVESIGMLNAEIELLSNGMTETLVAPNGNAMFVNMSEFDNISGRCEWHFGDGEIQKSCDDIIEHIYTSAGCFNPFLVIYNKNLPECRDTAFVENCIPVESSSFIEIPNIFSPNNDGYNDYFQVKAQTLQTFNGIIINRWGRKLFTWDNWVDYEAGWDGRLSGGTQASSGVYYYIIKAVGLDGEEYEYTGALQLVGK